MFNISIAQINVAQIAVTADSTPLSGDTRPNEKIQKTTFPVFQYLLGPLKGY